MLVVPATDTIVESQNGKTISAIPDRSKLYQGQTPQAFKAKLLKDLYYSLTEEEKDIVLVIASEKNDTARLIGKKGVIANSLREMVSVLGNSEGKHIHLKFESFDSDNE